MKEKPLGVHTHTSRFVYQCKYYTDGTIDKYKVRFVVRGFDFIKGKDYFESYAPVTQVTSAKMFYFLACKYGLPDKAYDVKSAFLNAHMDTEIWVEMPDAYEKDGCRYAQVNKAIPGVKQGAFLWFKLWNETLAKYGFVQEDKEPCLYQYRKNGIICLLLLHVDNIIWACNDEQWWLDTIKQWPFTITEVHGESILGLHIERLSAHSIAFSQMYYIDEMIKEFGLQDKPGVHVPLRPGIEKRFIRANMTGRVDAKIPYRRLVMKLYWIARCYRLHILYACNFLARFCDCYNQDLFDEALHVVLYLKKTREWKLIFDVDPNAPITLSFVCDADFAGADDRTSTFGAIGYIQNCPIFGVSGNIKTMVSSSTQSESHGTLQLGTFWFVDSHNNRSLEKYSRPH